MGPMPLLQHRDSTYAPWNFQQIQGERVKEKDREHSEMADKVVKKECQNSLSRLHRQRENELSSAGFYQRRIDKRKCLHTRLKWAISHRGHGHPIMPFPLLKIKSRPLTLTQKALRSLAPTFLTVSISSLFSRSLNISHTGFLQVPLRL